MSVQSPYSQYSQSPYSEDPQRQSQPQLGNRLAIAGVVFGIIGMFTWLYTFPALGIPIIGFILWIILFAIPILGIILSALGRSSPTRRDMATVGLVLSIISLVLTIAVRIMAGIANSHPQYGPELNINLSSGITIGDYWGYVLALLISPFLAFWMSAVKNHWLVVLGAFIGCLIGFFAILAWVGTLIFDTELPGATGAATFFGSVLICSATGVIGGILMDLVVARRTSRYYRRSQQLAHE